ncbi:hypothetical protein D8B24_16385 [Verminephrobacter aporrectodeae subsp. tuberculatae]|uniref:IS1634 family transposase n=1 Tax=Verminephrobacter aporrectodeae TaxID=1110389 RepID=UPI0022432F7E|nr:hypothetical protein [Verminephrobacter aporrectodeae]MCW8208569.1 hypothetical protein [Verminephrobacter aporrectodeae subsp. tuberculatae]
MPARTGAVHVATTTRKYKDKVYRTHLLRRSYREDGKVKNETLGNLSHLPESLIDIIRRSLQGETFVATADAFEIVRSRAHGHVQTVSVAMQRLGLASVLARVPSRERDLVLAMVAVRIVSPDTQLATTRQWHSSTLAEDFGVLDAEEDDLCAAMDWLLERQESIEQALATRHLRARGLALYDLSSSDFEGHCCPPAQRRTLQLNYGLLTDVRGCPVAVSVFDGNTADGLSFLPAVQQVRQRFGLDQVAMVGDRGTISGKAISEMRSDDGIAWITALESVSIRALVGQGPLQTGLFDERNPLEINRVRAHILLCMLAYYVEWHMREAWRELTFADTDQAAQAERDPVAPAKRLMAVQRKAQGKTLDNGQPVHGFHTRMAELATLVRNTCRTPQAGPDAPSFDVLTTANACQQRALELLGTIRS